MPTQPVRKSQKQRKEESEEKLFKALIQIINSDGVMAATCQRIGDQAGVSRGLATQRLGRRDIMFARLVDRLTQAQYDRLEAEGVNTLAPGDALRRYIDIHFEDIQHDPGYQAYFVMVAAAIAADPTLRDCVTQAEKFVQDILESHIRRGQQDGAFDRSIDPQSHAGNIGSTLLGAAIQSRLTGPENINQLKPSAYALVDAIEQ